MLLQLSQFSTLCPLHPGRPPLPQVLPTFRHRACPGFALCGQSSLASWHRGADYIHHQHQSSVRIPIQERKRPVMLAQMHFILKRQKNGLFQIVLCL